MASSKTPSNTTHRAWVRLYPADLQTVEHRQLSDAQYRCFIDLLCYEVVHGSIPNSPKLLAEITQKRAEWWQKASDKVLKFWRIDDKNSDRLVSDIPQRDAAEYAAICEKRRASGQKGGAATRERWSEAAEHLPEQMASHSEGHLPQQAKGEEKRRDRREEIEEKR
jgi:hypothetical protein